ncbi:hypothetical protein SAMN05192529_10298 [Arachidicoccus rhizosphaerae]|uniref:Uncharacterized protein n=1 Tax=Arachidicoccus rhizosphaerae TaxID=551991 RepID=A0A1H3W340_9BACT|nr:hypothetical protein [Arachidicoccus rhizosphaerae]SDZ81575.1 hypothetical protein SAMN05192529_10298 [Arachidicoccus rhizosphaerae]
MRTKTVFTPEQMIEFYIEEAKPVFWIQDIRIENEKAVLEVEMEYLGIKQGLVFIKPVQEVFTYPIYTEEDYSDMEFEAYRWLDKKAEDFKNQISKKLSETFKIEIAKWNK